MTPCVDLERLIDRVQLVRGTGDRRQRQFCVMSFVALLAGERHTDAPSAASPFLRQFAICLNDAMSTHRRQQLKLFAPRMIGTNDDRDNIRIEIARAAIADEVLPRLKSDGAMGWLPDRSRARLTAFADGPVVQAAYFPTSYLPATLLGGIGRWSAEHETRCVAREAANLLILCAHSAPMTVNGDWYWSKALELLDRFCDVGESPAAGQIRNENIARAERLLDTPAFGNLILSAFKYWWQGCIEGLSRRPRQVSPPPAQSEKFDLVVERANRPGQWDEVWTIAVLSSSVVPEVAGRP